MFNNFCGRKMFSKIDNQPECENNFFEQQRLNCSSEQNNTNCPICPPGPPGPPGPTGSGDTITVGTTTTGEAGTDAMVLDTTGSPNHVLNFVIPKGKDGTCPPCGSCGCVEQMKFVLSQLIKLYPTNNATINLESGGTETGRLSAIYPSLANGGLVSLKNAAGNLTGAVSLCKIASVTLPGATYNNAITFMPAPTPMPTDCSTLCQLAVNQALPVGTTKVNIKAGGKTIGGGTVLKNEFGMLVLTPADKLEPTFVSTCKVESINELVP